MTKIVVVEDQQVLATVYRNKFIAEGYQVEVASDGEAGVGLINSAKPDLVILDLMLPKMNGIEVLKRIRADPLFQTLPVIIFSNSSLPGMVEEAWKAGATAVLSKLSHSPKQIVESVRSALKVASETQSSATVVAANSPSVQSPRVLVSSPTPATIGRILLIEDHPDIRAIMSFVLDQVGHQVTTVESHAAALRKAKLEQFDLFLLNRVCPDGLGLTFCRQLQQLFPQHPIVLYSSAALPTEQQAGLDAGASAYVTMPEEFLDIGKLLSDVLEKSKTFGSLTSQ
jgi:CheY-like chemotaxis protein